MATRWRLAEIITRHNVQGKEIAQACGVCEETVTKWKREAPPLKRWDAIADAITKHSRMGGEVSAKDFLEEVGENSTTPSQKPTGVLHLASLAAIVPVAKEDAAIEAETAVYKAMFPLFESLQHQGLLKEDGHHMAKAVAVMAKQMICRCWELDGNQKTDTIS